MEINNETLNSYRPQFLKNMQEMLNENYETFLLSLNEPAKRGLRAKSEEEIEKLYPSNKKIPWCRNACYIASDDRAGLSPLHEAGAYYIQEPSAMLPAEILKPERSDFVLDLCAAPGGKSSQLALALNKSGCLVANEINPKRAKILSRNIERMGIENCIVLNNSPDELKNHFNACFDKILVDAPCSGEGMFRKNPLSRLEWTDDSPEACAKRQRQILACAKSMLKPGGKLLYSTCTFNRLENDDVIRSFLEENNDFELEKIFFNNEYHDMLHIFPHEIEGEGHFLALLKSKEASDSKKTSLATIEALNKNDLSDISSFNDFLTQNIENSAVSIKANYVFKESFVKLPEISFPLKGLNVLRLGLKLGEKNGRVFSFDHALSHAYTPFQQISLNEKEALEYLNGLSLSTDTLSDINKEKIHKGYASIMHLGYCLGLGKISDNQIKNHYPKGLRRDLSKAYCEE